MTNFYTEVKEIVDQCLQLPPKELELKTDYSLVTEVDKNINEQITEFYLSKNPDNPVIIAEESFEFKEEEFDLRGRDYLILDPIDGTENFTFLNLIYGFVLSARIQGEEFDMIYIPASNCMITPENLDKGGLAPQNEITFLSTGSLTEEVLEKIPRKSIIRVMGSSAFMFSQLILGNAKSYYYKSNCKIWDCFTGLRFAYSLGLKINGIDPIWFDEPSFYSKFDVSW